MLVVAFLLFVLCVATNPGEDMAVLGEHGVEDAASETPAAFVASAVVGQVAAATFGHRLRRKAGVAADVRGGGGVHGGDVADELLVDVVEFADTFLG